MLAIANNNLESSIGLMVDPYNFKLHNDTLETLRLVKSNMDTIVSLACLYSKKMGTPFSQMLRVGICSAIKAIKNYQGYDHEGFDEYLKREVSKAMLNYLE